MNSIDIAFVILNYNIVKETIDCINSIVDNIDTSDYAIIVVDNGSKKEIYQQLDTQLIKNDKLYLVRNDENLGFARGNNVGINLARELKAQFICCLNNDTILGMKDFFNVVKKKYVQFNSAVIGPRIILKNGIEQHRNGKLLSIEAYQRLLVDSKQERSKPSILNSIKRNYWIRVFYDKYIANLRKDRSKYYKETQDVILHGCCLIFTPVFFTKLDGFNPDTFLYMEEELLFAALKANGLHSLYAPDLEIHHLEDISTNATINNESEKKAFINMHTKKSLRVLIQYLKSHQEIYENENANG